MSRDQALPERVGASLSEPDGPRPGDRVVVAVSGGMDSVTLLHLLRFPLGGVVDPVVAHFDHALRPASSSDADWLRGVCRAWSLPLRTARAAAPPASEAEGRGARYDFLESVRRDERADWVLTGHHADDQAETVLFRVLRGSGLSGLTGIAAVRGTVHRPLLDIPRDELAAYARQARLSWRQDPTNADITMARNAIRHRILPAAERLVAGGARRALARLARVAADDRAALESLLEDRLAELVVDRDETGFVLERASFLREHPAVRARVVRRLAERLGIALDERGTRIAVAFTSSGRSGGGIDLGGGVTLSRQLDRMIIRRISSGPGADRPLSIPGPDAGRGEARLGGRSLAVVWGASPEGVQFESAELRVPADHYPLLVRGFAPGDRIRLVGGSRKLKKIFLEARIPSDRRGAVPIVVDATGSVRWVPGIARAPDPDPALGGATLLIGIER